MDFDNENRIISPDLNEIDNDIEVSLRPKTFNEYIGQEKAKENLKVYIEAAKSRGDVLDHILLSRSRATLRLCLPTLTRATCFS